VPLKPSYLLLAGGGAIIAFAGLKGYGVSAAIRDVISGKNPSASPTPANPIAGQTYSYGVYGQSPLSSLGPAGTTGAGHGGIVGLAEANPLPYQWGGAPANGKTDCSGWVNWIVGHLAGLSIPGSPNGSYTGKSHGPSTLVWLAWLGTGITQVPRAQAGPGDLAIWQTHMGIITDNGQNMISDLNPADGTRATTIDGVAPFGEVLVCARLR
jgi:cell wall-associated NlpC family hydrolase